MKWRRAVVPSIVGLVVLVAAACLVVFHKPPDEEPELAALAGHPVVEPAYATPSAEPEKAGPATPGRELKDTIVTPCLGAPIPVGKNVLWCATFQMAWNELIKAAGEPIRMQDQPPLADLLNKRSADKVSLAPEDFVAVSGLMSEGILKRINGQVSDRFGGRMAPQLLSTSGDLPQDGVVVYGGLLKQLPFKWCFRRTDPGFFGLRAAAVSPTASGLDRARVSYFGIDEFDPTLPDEIRRANQVKVLWHEFIGEPPRGEGFKRVPQHFVVEIQTQSDMDRLILAKVPPEPTLSGTVARVLRLAADPNTRTCKDPTDPEEQVRIHDLSMRQTSAYASLLPYEELEIPVIDVMATWEFPELCGRPIQCKSSAISGKPVAQARQQICFRLDETGATLQSESIGYLMGFIPRHFDFSAPFLVLLLRKGDSQPYFALWVANEEVLEAATPAKTAAN